MASRKKNFTRHSHPQSYYECIKNLLPNSFDCDGKRLLVIGIKQA
jgi:hypothetical protein